MRTFLFLLFIGTCEFSFAQTTYEKIFLTGGSMKLSCSELPSGDLFMGLGCAHGISRIDHQGSILQTQCYMPNPMVGFTAFRKVSANAYAFATSYILGTCSQSGSTVPRYQPAIGLMDTTGTVLGYKYYELDQACWNRTGNLTVTSDQGVITWGYDTSFFAIRVDPSLSPLWAKRYNRKGGFHFIKELPGGDFLAGINMDTAGAVVARLDAVGNMLWCRSYIRPTGRVHDAFIESDDSFIITGYTDYSDMLFTEPMPPTFQPKLFMMKLDGNGELQWCRGYDSAPYHWHTSSWTRIERTLDDEYAVLATLGMPGYNFPYKPFLMKTNLSADTLWTRAIGRPQYALRAYDLLVHSDGTYVVSGEINGDLQGQLGGIFLFKGDSLGHFPCWDQPNQVQVLDLFPVDSAFTLSSTVLITETPSQFPDTIFPFTILDGCTFTTGINPMVRKGQGMRVRPNPNTGQFTVEFTDPLMADSYYSVYDAMGKLLYQRPLPTGKETEEIDLSRFGSGTYVIKFTSPAGVCHERVVLE